MIEKVARAIHEVDASIYRNHLRWEELSSHQQELPLMQARAAIEAMMARPIPDPIGIAEERRIEEELGGE